MSGWHGLAGLRKDTHAANLPVLSARCSTLIGRAQLANLLAERTFRPSDVLPFAGADAVACELAREAIYWALLALRERAEGSAPNSAEGSFRASSEATFATLWSETDSELLDRAAGGPGQAERLRAELLEKSFADFAELSPPLQAAAAVRLHGFAERLIEPIAFPQRAAERAWLKRMQLSLLALVVLVGLGFAVKSLKARDELNYDLAASASWQASSQFAPECACQSPEQSCAACPNFFFCTAEEERPSIVFDLHRVEKLSAVVVENRRDCCPERALPLMVQVSQDQKHWKTVATRKDEFSTWRADFHTEKARWVKLSVGRRNFLHLSRVRLLP